MEINMSISPNDHMLTSSLEAYKRTSLSGLKCVQNAVSSANKDVESIKNILDFGCGYGRVLRALKAGYPNASITACDLMPDAVEYCKNTFNVNGVIGHEDLGRIVFDIKFDIVWVGSVFTHLPVKRWTELLTFLESILNPDGILVFTVHGRTSLWVFENHTLSKSNMKREDFERVKREFSDTGYSFFNYPTTHTNYLSTNKGIQVSEHLYGLSFTRPDWVLSYLLNFKSLYLANYTEGGWSRNHDVISLWKPSDPRDIDNKQ